MIQSRFQKQHADKHPQHPENGGSGPKPMPASRDATSNIRANRGKGGVDVGLRVPVHFAEGDSEWTEDMRPEDADAMNSQLRPRTAPEELKEHLPLLRGRTRGQKPSDGDADDKAIGALAADTRAGDSKGAMKRMMEFSREQVMRGKKK